MAFLWGGMAPPGWDEAVLVPRDDVQVDDGHGWRQPRIGFADLLEVPGWLPGPPRMTRANQRRGWHRFEFDLVEVEDNPRTGNKMNWPPIAPQTKSAPAVSAAEAQGPALAEPTRNEDDTTVETQVQTDLVDYPAVLVLARIDRPTHSVFACVDGRVLHNDIELDQRLQMFYALNHAGGLSYTYTLASLDQAENVMATRRQDLEVELGI